MQRYFLSPISLAIVTLALFAALSLQSLDLELLFKNPALFLMPFVVLVASSLAAAVGAFRLSRKQSEQA